MLDSQSAAFAERVWEVASQLGNNAPKIADDIMGEAFPLTCSQARAEGAMRMLRIGIISEVKRILRNRHDALTQTDFADRCEAFAPLVSDLRSKSYFVESAQEYVVVQVEFSLARFHIAEQLLQGGPAANRQPAFAIIRIGFDDLDAALVGIFADLVGLVVGRILLVLR